MTLRSPVVAQVVEPVETDRYIMPDALRDALDDDEGVAVIRARTLSTGEAVLSHVPLPRPLADRVDDRLCLPDDRRVSLRSLPEEVEEGDRLGRVELIPEIVSSTQKRGKIVDSSVEVLLWDALLLDRDVDGIESSRIETQQRVEGRS